MFEKVAAFVGVPESVPFVASVKPSGVGLVAGSRLNVTVEEPFAEPEAVKVWV
jgi:hypothetical protein